MKKTLSVLLLVAVLVTMTMGTVAFAATGEHPNQILQTPIDTSDWESYTDSKSGLSFSYPDYWTLTVSKAWGSTTSGSNYTKKVIKLTSITGEYTIKITELKVASLDEGKKFIVNDNNNNIYYVSNRQAISLVDGDAVYLSHESRENSDLQNALNILKSISMPKM